MSYTVLHNLMSVERFGTCCWNIWGLLINLMENTVTNEGLLPLMDWSGDCQNINITDLPISAENKKVAHAWIALQFKQLLWLKISKN